MGINIMVLMVGEWTGKGDGGWDGDLTVKLGLAFMRVMVIERRGSPRLGGRGRGGEVPFSGGGSGLERRRPPVQD